jgi:protein-disulfide isomerase
MPAKAKKDTPNMGIPAAIIIAAVIIGIALVAAFGGGNSGPGAPAAPAAGPVDTRPTITEAAKTLDISTRDLESCIADGTTRSAVEADMLDARESGARGTPYTVIVGPDGETFPVSGNQDVGLFNIVIDQLIAGAERSEDIIDLNNREATRLITESIIRNEGLLPQLENDLTGNVEPIAADEPIQGNRDAAVSVIEFSDIDCLFCAGVHPRLEQLVASRDDIKWAYRHLPLTDIHPEAFGKAQAAECVLSLSDEDTYWEYLDLLISG